MFTKKMNNMIKSTMKEIEVFTNKYKDYNIVLFDGVCNFCESSVKFIIEHDTLKHFYFMTQSSKEAQDFIQQHKLEELDTIILFSKNKIYTHSDAALEITKALNGWYRHLYLFRFIPKFIRDIIYKVIAKYRYSFFGKKENCMIPNDEILSRFLN
jgi:predicted DCC family thiol-disulfide oxidoreductase YuxK